MKKNHNSLYDLLISMDELRDETQELALQLNHLSFKLNELVKMAKESAHCNISNMEHYLCSGQTPEDIKKLKSLITEHDE